MLSNDPKRAYLITYSKADLTKFPTRKSFADACAESFDKNSERKIVSHYACCLEYHDDESPHYHVSIKLNSSKRWRSAKDYMFKNFGVVVNFAENPNSFYTGAYRYISKNDSDVYHSENHPPLESIGSPVTKKCVAAYRNKHSNKNKTPENNSDDTPGSSQGQKKRKLSRLHVGDFIVNNKIKTEDELFAAAKKRRKEGETDLAEFIFKMTSKSRIELIDAAWKLEESDDIVERQKRPRMDVIREAAHLPCDGWCNGIWIQCALEILTKSRINPCMFANSLRELLEKGRGKYRNLLVTGEANCGKTFLFDPLRTVFKGALCNPSSTKFAWIGADIADVIFLNDYRWKPEQITWDQMLRFLEGQIGNLPAPMNHFNKDIHVDSDVPIFATSKGPVLYYEGNPQNAVDHADKYTVENEMMNVRWNHYHLSYQIPKEEQIKDIPKCRRCFSKLVLMTDEDFF